MSRDWQCPQCLSHLAKSIIAEVLGFVKYLSEFLFSLGCVGVHSSLLSYLALSPLGEREGAIPPAGVIQSVSYFQPGTHRSKKGGTQRAPQEADGGKPEGRTAAQERHQKKQAAEKQTRSSCPTTRRRTTERSEATEGDRDGRERAKSTRAGLTKQRRRTLSQVSSILD